MKATHKIHFIGMKLFLIAIFVLSTNSSFAQFGGLGKKLKDKVEKKANETIDNSGKSKETKSTSSSEKSSNTNVSSAEKKSTKNEDVANVSTGNFNDVNTIVWSTKKYPNGPQSNADIATTFKSGEPVYATANLSAKLIDRIREGGDKLYLTFKIDGKKIHFYDPYLSVTQEMKQKNIVQFILVPALTDDVSLETKDGNKTFKEFNEWMAAKDPMTYAITVFFEFSKTKEKIEGSFNYDLSGGTEYNKEVAKKLEDAMAGEVKLPVAAMKNAALETQMITLVNKYAKKGEKYTNPRILTADWQINKNNLGIIIDRTIMTAFVASFPDGHCELIRKIFIQEYAGGGNYSNNLKMLDDPYAPKKIDCANANK